MMLTSMPLLLNKKRITNIGCHAILRGIALDQVQCVDGDGDRYGDDLQDVHLEVVRSRLVAGRVVLHNLPKQKTQTLAFMASTSQ
eukprot:4007476-Heterocapsa_arctica.AAC.1